MHKLSGILLSLISVTTVTAFAYAQPPESANVTGVTNQDWPDGISSVASIGQLIQQRAPTTTVPDIIIRSGLATQGALPVKRNSALMPHPRLGSNGPMVDVARLCGAGYAVASGGAPAGSTIYTNADSVVKLKGQAAAMDALKTRIAAGSPVQVHLDMYYVWEEVASQEPVWQTRTKAHVSHFVVVHGYDTSNVYFADNGPIAQFGPNSENVRVSWTAFLLAWGKAGTVDRGALGTGPYYMLYLVGPMRFTYPEWTLAYVSVDAQGAPANFRKVAAMARKPKKGFRQDKMLANAWLFAAMRPYAAAYATAHGEAMVAAAYTATAAQWAFIRDNPTSSQVADTLDQIAGSEEGAIAKMHIRATQVAPICCLAPDGVNVGPLGWVTFRWIALPDVTQPQALIGMTNFQNETASIVLLPKRGASFVVVSPKLWMKLLPGDDGDKRLGWRVRGYRGTQQVTAVARIMNWTVSQLTSVGPGDGTSISPTALPTFSWQFPPPLTLRPKVALSADASFANRKAMLYLTPRKGTLQMTMSKAVYNAISKKAGASKTVYWRMEDASAKITTVLPSTALTLLLP